MDLNQIDLPACRGHNRSEMDLPRLVDMYKTDLFLDEMITFKIGRGGHTLKTPLGLL